MIIPGQPKKLHLKRFEDAVLGQVCEQRRDEFFFDMTEFLDTAAE